jgi:inosine/xanthosine triphosphate pyrophosphatase family protein
MQKPKIVLASGNTHKIIEISSMLPDYEVIGYKQLGLDFEIDENGTTF